MTQSNRCIGLLLLGLAAPLQAQVDTSQFGAVGACRSADGRIPVLLVGSYHMANPGLDRFNLKADDVLTPSRQAEVITLVQRLAAFRPTKVLIEQPWQDSAVATAYRAYRAGGRLSANEYQQIGFRLAGQLGHASVFPIDVGATVAGNPVEAFVGAHPEQGRLLADLDRFGRGAIGVMAEWLAHGTVGEMLAHLNEPDRLRQANQPYLRYFLPLVAGDDYAGADFVADWYRRNLRIMANIDRTATAPGDRLFVIYGQGHAALLRPMLEDSGRLCPVDPLPFLREP
jgi:hypothetical protein